MNISKLGNGRIQFTDTAINFTADRSQIIFTRQSDAVYVEVLGGQLSKIFPYNDQLTINGVLIEDESNLDQQEALLFGELSTQVKEYEALIYLAAGVVTATVLKNTFGFALNWTRPQAGILLADSPLNGELQTIAASGSNKIITAYCSLPTHSPANGAHANVGFSYEEFLFQIKAYNAAGSLSDAVYSDIDALFLTSVYFKIYG